jgi:hypothetical protein
MADPLVASFVSGSKISYELAAKRLAIPASTAGGVTRTIERLDDELQQYFFK